MIRRQITLPVDAGRLWTALTDPTEAEGWLGGRIEWVMEEGSLLRYVDADGTEKAGRVDIVRPERYLRFRWAGENEPPSEVSYLLQPDGDQTRLTIQETSRPEDLLAGPQNSVAPARRDSAGQTAWTMWDTALLGLWSFVAVPAICAIVA